jgi:recombination protein RecA
MGKAKDQIQLLRTTMAAIEKQFGKGAIMHLGDSAPHQEVETISSGSLGIDLALGTGGFPKGRITEIFGPEASGKTTLALQAIAQCQEQGGVCAFIDAEHSVSSQTSFYSRSPIAGNKHLRSVKCWCVREPLI